MKTYFLLTFILLGCDSTQEQKKIEVIKKDSITQPTPAIEQSFKIPTIKSSGKSIEEFIPGDWKVLDKVEGDLNKDNMIDAAIVIEYTKEVTIESNEDGEETADTSKPRVLFILLKDSAGTYNLSTQSNDFILLSSDGAMLGDPYSPMEIQNGSLILNFTGGGPSMWVLKYRFRYQNNDWYLIGATNTGLVRGTGDVETYDYNFITGDVEIKKGNISEEKEMKKKINIGKTPLRTFKTFIRPWSWEVYDGQSI
jgi:hypothetical protein